MQPIEGSANIRGSLGLPAWSIFATEDRK